MKSQESPASIEKFIKVYKREYWIGKFIGENAASWWLGHLPPDKPRNKLDWEEFRWTYKMWIKYG